VSRPALSASRSIEVIELLATFPDRAFTVSEIVKATKINIASCIALLKVLTDKGYLVRAPKLKTYQLGPSLIAAGNAAQKSHPLIDQVTRAAHGLLGEVGLPVLLSTVVGDELLAVVSLEDGAGRNAGMQVGERLPLMAPVGTPFLAWADEAAVDAWVARRKAPLDPVLLRSLRADLALTRERGYHIALRHREEHTIGALMSEMARSTVMPDYKVEVSELIRTFTEPMCKPIELAAAETYDVLMIAAPIFDQNGSALFNLCLGGFPPQLTGAVLLEYADRLSRTCLQIMRADRTAVRRQVRSAAA
jgi:DNA-binding IclR family transcriptional regulator